jgi:hypothetical protein
VLNEKRLNSIKSARAILDVAKKEGRGMNGDEVARYDAFMSEADTLKATIDRERTANERDAESRARVPDVIRETGRAVVERFRARVV